MTYGYALQVLCLAVVMGAVGLGGLYIGSRRVERQIARLKAQEAADRASAHPPQPQLAE